MGGIISKRDKDVPAIAEAVAGPVVEPVSEPVSEPVIDPDTPLTELGQTRTVDLMLEGPPLDVDVCKE